MWQANWVSQQLHLRGIETELVTISTHGDVSTESLRQVGGQGVFVKEIQRELVAGKVDVAVHSLKDLPTQPVSELLLAAVPARETTDDCLVSRTGKLFDQLPKGATVGTGSLRRAAQLLAWRQDITIADIRGNVDSRLRKLDEGRYDAIVLAAAGMTRLKLWERVTECLPKDRILPAIGQGALGLECRAEDMATQSALKMLDDAQTHLCVTAERALLGHLLAGCLAPVAALGLVQDNQLSLTARVISRDGRQQINDSKCVQLDDLSQLRQARDLGASLAKQLLQQGAAELISQARDDL